jgi:hypothetical protein
VYDDPAFGEFAVKAIGVLLLYLWIADRVIHHWIKDR